MRASELASRFGYGHAGPDSDITTVCSYEDIKQGALVPLLGKETPEGIFDSCAGAFLVKTGADTDNGKTFIISDDPEIAIVNIINLLHPVKKPAAAIHPMAFISQSAVVGEDVSVGPFSFIGENCVIGRGTVIHNNVSVADGVVIGEDCVIYPNTSLYSGTKLKDRVILHSGSVIGADGFGYYPRKGVHVKIPHIGGVLLENDVEVGANACVDRGKFSDTIIGSGSKLDNQTMVAHNSHLGTGCIMAGQSAVPSSVTLGDYVIMGARSGIADHTHVCSQTILAAQCGVISDIEKPGIYAGFPHNTRKAWFREQALIRSLPELVKRIAELERKTK